ncbi:hypothetical protein SSX86_006929 [Deinandra increscens subsp. villosa]|uniref:FBD domain-containing protein n=1 Tax=Deinandra increscens subsp. villosa TaxID=3103831 RepID=A0AAP0DH13_9ASTR
MENVSSLVEASVSFNNLSFDYRWLELLKGLNGVKSFSAEDKSLLYMKTPIFSRSSWPIFPNLKRLELKGFRDSGLIPQFLESCPKLKHLCIEKVEGRLCKRENLLESSWIEPRFVPACMVTNLTTIELSKFIGRICDVQFLEYMLRNAEVLESLKIAWENLCLEEAMFCEWLLAVPRASRHCEIHFLGSGSPK